MKTTFIPFVVIFFTLMNPAASFSQWVQLNAQFTANIQCFAASTNPNDTTKTDLFAGTWGDGIFHSTNDGQSWARVDSGLTNLYVNTLALYKQNLYAGTNNGFFLSENNGASWIEIDSGLTNKNVYSILAIPSTEDSLKTNLFAGIWGNGIFLSKNDGTSWIQVDSGLTNWNVYSLITSPPTSGTGDPNIFAGTYGGGIFLSTNNGTSWTAVNKGITNKNIYSLIACPVAGGTGGTNIYASIYGWVVYGSTNTGKSWSSMSVGLTSYYNTCFAVSTTNGGTNLFTGSWGNGVFMSTNYGNQWNAVNSGLSNTYIWTICISGRYLFAGTSGYEIWRRPLSEMTTDVKDVHDAIPNRFGLNQNYPNPFNPSTTISFNVPSKSFVLLKIFDELGREVSTLVSKELTTGQYAQLWNASGLPSGVYFYRLQAGSYTETKKLVLLK